jgi:hypothetical protein
MVEGAEFGKDYTFNTTLVRYGLNKNFELRLIQEYLGYQSEIEGSNLISGMSPMSIGAKIKLADARGFIPQMAFIGHVTFPTGSPDVNSTYVTTDFRITMEYELSDRFSFGVNLGAEGDGESPLTTGIYTVVVGYSISDKIGMFSEFYGFITENDETNDLNTQHDHRFNGGFTYKINNIVQYDVSAGVGLSQSSTDYFLSTGLSFRLFK